MPWYSTEEGIRLERQAHDAVVNFLIYCGWRHDHKRDLWVKRTPTRYGEMSTAILAMGQEMQWGLEDMRASR